jgi:hypothetical protein
VARGLHMFQVHLSALDLDFHPVRSRSRRKVQTLLTALYGAPPEPAEFAQPAPPETKWGDETVTALPGPAATVAEARTEGPAVLAAAAARLAKLLSDIRDRAALTAKLTPV